MANFDVEALLNEVSGGSPTGEDFEYNADFAELMRSAERKPEQQYGATVIPAVEPDWRSVEKQAIALFKQTKDLRVGVTLTTAAVNMSGFSGLASGLAVILGLIERYWDNVHPRLDPDDDNDPTLRMNILAGLSDPETTLRAAREAPLVESRAMGRFGMKDVEAATAAGAASGAGSLSSSIDAAFQDAAPEGLKAIGDAVSVAYSTLRAIESALSDRVASHERPDLEALNRLLRSADKLMTDRLDRRGLRNTAEPAGEDMPEGQGDVVSEAGAGGNALGGNTVRHSGRIENRNDVLAALDGVCDYYSRVEPSSPVPVLLERTKGLVNMSFSELLQNLAPDGVAQFDIFKSKN